MHWHLLRSDYLLEKWADQNQLRILKRSYRWLFKGTLFWSVFSRAVYRVTVEDQAGHPRSGWVRCGGWFWGLLSDDVVVRWDD